MDTQHIENELQNSAGGNSNYDSPVYMGAPDLSLENVNWEVYVIGGGAAAKGVMFLRVNKFYGPSKRNGRIFGFRNRSNPKKNTYRLDYHRNSHNTKLHNHGVNDVPKDGIFR